MKKISVTDMMRAGGISVDVLLVLVVSCRGRKESSEREGRKGQL